MQQNKFSRIFISQGFSDFSDKVPEVLLKTILLPLLCLFTSLPLLGEDCYNCERPQRFSAPVVNPWPIEYVTINKVPFERNNKASFCRRPVEMVDTIVLHHSETPSTTTPEDINRLHLSRGTPEDPWYMIAYSYNINSPYSGASTPKARVTEGRPMELVGAHAGSEAFVPMDESQKKMWDDGLITCGKENQEFKVNPSMIRDGKIKANVTTIGVVVIGNYAPFSRTNPNGYHRNRPRYPTKSTQDLIARLSCQLQKKYPKITNIKWHNYYNATSCPGSIKEYISKIISQTRKYGCDFK